MVLIISDRFDPHAQLILRRLTEKGVHAAIFDLAEIPGRARISVAIADRGGWHARVSRAFEPKELDLSAVRSVWLRRTHPFKADGELTPEDREFANYESLCTWMGLSALLADRFWVNPPLPAFAQDMGHGKLGQLETAKRLGLAIPRTLATNDPADARAFVQSCSDGAIYKPFRSPRRKHEREGKVRWSVVYTNRLDPAAMAKIESVRYSPCIFQEYVPKRIELRVTVIGKQVFAAEIHSQVQESSTVDFRRHHDLQNTPYAPHSLPPEIAAQCVELNRELGLVFGAIDLILTPDGRYVFLENNQQGQFLWLEAMAGLPLIEHFTEMLIQGTPDYHSSAGLHAPGPLPPGLDDRAVLPIGEDVRKS